MTLTRPDDMQRITNPELAQAFTAAVRFAPLTEEGGVDLG